MRKLSRRVVFLVTMVSVMGMAGSASANVKLQREAYGMSLGDWSAAWWQYVLAIPAVDNPAADSTGAKCGVDQANGKIFFLTGNFTSDTTVTRNCSIPAGRTLIIPIVNTECSTVEAPPFFGANEKDLRVCAPTGMDGVDLSSLTLIIDGKPVKNLADYRAQSPVFTFYLPAGNIFGLPEGPGSAVSDGFWAIVPPLSSGSHTVSFGGTIALSPTQSFTVDVKYNLTVE